MMWVGGRCHVACPQHCLAFLSRGRPGAGGFITLDRAGDTKSGMHLPVWRSQSFAGCPDMRAHAAGHANGRMRDGAECHIMESRTVAVPGFAIAAVLAAPAQLTIAGIFLRRRLPAAQRLRAAQGCQISGSWPSKIPPVRARGDNLPKASQHINASNGKRNSTYLRASLAGHLLLS